MFNLWLPSFHLFPPVLFFFNFSYHRIKRFTSKAVICKTFYITTFLILILQELTSVFLTVYSGLSLLKRNASDVNINLLKVYYDSIYIAEGLFAVNLLLLFWILKNSYKHGQTNLAEHLLRTIKGISYDYIV